MVSQFNTRGFEKLPREIQEQSAEAIDNALSFYICELCRNLTESYHHLRHCKFQLFCAIKDELEIRQPKYVEFISRIRHDERAQPIYTLIHYILDCEPTMRHFQKCFLKVLNQKL